MKENRFKNWTTVQIIIDELFNCGSSMQQLLTLTEVLRNYDIRKTNNLISSTSNLSSNSFKHSPCLFDLIKQCNDTQSDRRSTWRAWLVLISKTDIYDKVDINVCFESNNDSDIVLARKLKSGATNSII